MNKNIVIAKDRSGLRDDFLQSLEELSRQIDQIADLTQCPVFIDLIEKKSGLVYVWAEAHPRRTTALYSRPVAGNYAYEYDEPAVYKALRTGQSVMDTKAVTQESRVVLQNVLPVADKYGRYLAALIMERDITWDVRREEKLELLSVYSDKHPKENLSNTSPDDSLARESYHRVKNDLQYLVSQGQIHLRQGQSEGTRKLLENYISSILTVASLYDTISQAEKLDEVDALDLLKRLVCDLSALTEGRAVIEVDGNSLLLDGEKARVIAIVANELIHNALKHGGREKDLLIRVELSKGHTIHSLTIRDNGGGLLKTGRKRGRGLVLLELLASRYLNGMISISSTRSGVSAVLNFSS